MKQEDISPEDFSLMVKASMQRAAIMGLIAAILLDEVAQTADDIKTRICNVFGSMSERNLLVQDFIDVEVATLAVSYLEQKIAVEQVNEMLKS